MKLWYTKWELPDAEKEAQSIIDDIMRDIHAFIRGDVFVRMAWREINRSREIIPRDEWVRYTERAIPIFIPEAELVVNGEVCRRDLLDLLHIDILHLEMSMLRKAQAVGG